MKYSWRLYWPSCSYVLFSFLIVGNQGIPAEVESLRLVSDMFDRVRSTTEPPLKSRNIVSELKNSNILRDRNAHPINQDGSRSMLADMRNTWSLETSTVYIEQVAGIAEDQQIANQSNDGGSDMPAVTSSYNNEGDHSNLLDSWLRNTRDLAYHPTASNDTETDLSHDAVNDSKLGNSSVYIVDSDVTTPMPNTLSTQKNETLTFSLQNATIADNLLNISSNISTNKTARVNPATPSSYVKNPKDKENKTKLEVNSKPIKKMTANVKNKLNVSVENSTHGSNRTENITEYSNEIPSNSSALDISKNITVLTNSSNGESLNSSESQVSASSRQTMPEEQGLQTLSIALIVVAVIAVICTITGIGMLSVMFYRRYHWNKPQTFSDKCSNADSTGYIDDSTLKENSEEMYSLDNDSFLNSLEAMTIQNYWADSIRHTKL